MLGATIDALLADSRTCRDYRRYGALGAANDRSLDTENTNMTTAMMTTPAPLTMTSSTRDLDIVNAVRDSFVDVMGLDCHGDTRVEQCPMTGCIEIDYGRFVIGNIDAPVWQIIKQEYDLDDRTVVGPFTFNTTARADETDVATIVAAVVYTVVRHSLLA